LLYTGLGVRRRDDEEKVKEDFDRKFKALLNIPPPEKDK